MMWGSESSHIYMAMTAIIQFNSRQHYTANCFYPVPGTGRVSESDLDVVVSFDKMGGGRILCRRGRLSNDWDVI